LTADFVPFPPPNDGRTSRILSCRRLEGASPPAHLRENSPDSATITIQARREKAAYLERRRNPEQP
jgi:hypothetical protein